MRMIINLLVTAAVAYLLTMVIPGVEFTGFGAAVIFVIVLGLLNIFVKPILKIFGLPLTILTLGLFSLVINAIVVLLADYFIDGMDVNGFWTALIYSIALSILSSVATSIFSGSED